MEVNKSQGNDNQTMLMVKMADEGTARFSSTRQFSASLTTEDLIHPHKASEIPG